MIRVEIKPELLSWARERAGYDADALAPRFPKLTAWEQGTAQPTLKQTNGFASATHTPIGFLFLQEPPVENIPIPDFRTVSFSFTSSIVCLPVGFRTMRRLPVAVTRSRWAERWGKWVRPEVV